jgi:hypothetical protein
MPVREMTLPLEETDPVAQRHIAKVQAEHDEVAGMKPRSSPATLQRLESPKPVLWRAARVDCQYLQMGTGAVVAIAPLPFGCELVDVHL